MRFKKPKYRNFKTIIYPSMNCSFICNKNYKRFVSGKVYKISGFTLDCWWVTGDNIEFRVLKETINKLFDNKTLEDA